MKDHKRSNDGGTSARITPTHALLAGTLLAVVVMPLAFASASNPVATSSASAKKQIKALQKRVAALEGKQAPTTLPPNGPAGGDLTGTYPNPTIGPAKVDTTKLADNAVTTTKLADNAVTSPKILDGSVGTADIGSGAVGSNELKGIVPTFSGATTVAAGSSTLFTVPCPGGFAISGGGTWDSTDPDLAISQSFPLLGAWVIRAANQDGAAHDFNEVAMCLPN